MFVWLVIALIFIGFSLRYLEETFSFYCAFKILALGAMCIKYSPPALSLETLLNFWWVFIFYSRGYFNNLKEDFYNFPLRKYFKLALVSILLSAIFSIMPLSHNITRLIMVILDDFVIPVIFYIVLIINEKFIKWFLYSLLFVFTGAAIFGIVEFVIGYNPFQQYLLENVGIELLRGKIYFSEERIGLERIKSLFVSPNNMIYGAFIASFAYIYNKSNTTGDKIPLILPFAFLAIVVIFMANSRTVLISSIFILLPLFLGGRESFKYGLFAAIALLIAYPFFSQYWANITSVLSMAEEDQIGGSSLEMRAEQLEASYNLFLQSPILGNGYGSISYFVSETGGGMSDKLRGTESIWFKLLIERGLLGLISYIYLFINIQKRYRMLSNYHLLFYVGGYLLANTASSLPGFNMSFLYMTLISIGYILEKKE